MDPHACVARLVTALADDDREEAFYTCNEMINWLAKGGFEVTLRDGQPFTIAFFRNLRHLLKRSQGGAA